MNTQKLNVSLKFDAQEILVGQMIVEGKQILFKYADSYLEDGYNISPLKLQFNDLVQMAPANPFNGIFGVFSDSLPDAWGQLLFRKKLSKKGIAIETLNALDHLAYNGNNGNGALIYKPAIQEKDVESVQVNLDHLDLNIQKIIKGESKDIIDNLFKLGGSPGGARPKIYAYYNPNDDSLIYGDIKAPKDHDYWIIKFGSNVDAGDIAQIEWAYYKMAMDAGLEISECKLFTGLSGKKYFGTRRFDRIGNKQLHMLSSAGLLHDDYIHSQLDYGVLMQEGKQLVGSANVYERILRHAAFNIFSHNRDDHSKNFAFLMNNKGEWNYSPVYDLTFSYSSQGQHSTTCAGNGSNPGTKELLELADHFSVKKGKEIIDEVKSSISNWKQYAKLASVSKDSTNSIDNVLQSLIKH